MSKIALCSTFDTDGCRLTHNVFGPHDEKFHMLWNELRDEHEALTRKGYTGEGFLSPGHQLGGSSNKPPHELRRLARAAVEKRRAQTAFRPRRVGGSGPSDVTDVRKTIADAAQRRRDILKGCGDTETDPKAKDQVLAETERNGVQTVAEIDDAYTQAIQQAFMDMVRKDADDNNKSKTSPLTYRTKPSNSNPNSGNTRPPPLPTNSVSNSNSNSGNMGPPPLPTNSVSNSSGDKWDCPICTYLNPATYLCCEVCLMLRPSDLTTLDSNPSQQRPALSSNKSPPGNHKAQRSSAAAANIAKFKEAEQKSIDSKPLGWTCHRCGNFTEQQWWLCDACGTMKLSS